MGLATETLYQPLPQPTDARVRVIGARCGTRVPETSTRSGHSASTKKPLTFNGLRPRAQLPELAAHRLLGCEQRLEECCPDGVPGLWLEVWDVSSSRPSGISLAQAHSQKWSMHEPSASLV
jgi:hypothetical protein